MQTSTGAALGCLEPGSAHREKHRGEARSPAASEGLGDDPRRRKRCRVFAVLLPGVTKGPKA